MLNNAVASEHEGQFELQIASETASWVRRVALEASRNLHHAMVSEHEGKFELQIANETAS